MARAAPIFEFNGHRSELVAQTVDRVLEDCRDPLYALNDAAYHEIRRLDGSRRPKDVERLESWRALARTIGRMSEGQRRDEVRKIAQHHAEDIAGNFDPRVFRVATRLLPTLVTALLNPSALPGMVRTPDRLFSLEALGDKVQVQGDIAQLEALAVIGTLVFMPTHSSNMDSIVFGYTLERCGLPPATYGAGKNLFTNPILSFFMHNLGAYKVDRRLRLGLYKACLKAYSTVLIENGYHSLFFPGGTRSRSGAVEQRLKLGLMGTGVEAYARTVARDRERKVFFVPATINYLVTLEAETLIADYLGEAGKARYIIDDDESTRLGRVTSFVRKLLAMNDSVIIRFGQPLDPFGSAVDDAGRSLDRRGRAVDSRGYVEDLAGGVAFEPAREAQYTRELGREIAAAYLRDTVVMSTHLVAAACFEHLARRAGSNDLFAVLRQRDELIGRDDLGREVLRLRDKLADRERAGEVVLAEAVRGCSGGDIVAQAMQALGGYHSAPVLVAQPDGVRLRDAKLLYYYQNRLVGHGAGFLPREQSAARATAVARRRA